MRLEDLICYYPLSSAHLSATSICQLRCPVCETAKGFNRRGVLGSGHLKAVDLIRFLDLNPSLRKLEISHYGELFQNPEASAIFHAAFLKKVSLTVTNGVNLNYLSDEQCDALVKYAVRMLTIAIDGASAKTYSIYRQGGDFDTVLGNVARINAVKKKYNSVYPELCWQFIPFSHNEHEISAARSMAEALGMSFHIKLNAAESYAPVGDVAGILKASGVLYATREAYLTATGRIYGVPCHQLWQSPQINWDGKLLGCCSNLFGSLGEAFTQPLDVVMQGPLVVQTKKILLGLEPVPPDSPCAKCYVFTEKIKDKSRVLSIIDNLFPAKTRGRL